MTITRCNVCGKEFDAMDNQNGFSISSDNIIGFGSEHDGEICSCDLCTSCFDGIMQSITFRLDPFIDFSFEQDGML